MQWVTPGSVCTRYVLLGISAGAIFDSVFFWNHWTEVTIFTAEVSHFTSRDGWRHGRPPSEHRWVPHRLTSMSMCLCSPQELFDHDLLHEHEELFSNTEVTFLNQRNFSCHTLTQSLRTMFWKPLNPFIFLCIGLPAHPKRNRGRYGVNVPQSGPVTGKYEPDQLAEVGIWFKKVKINTPNFLFYLHKWMTYCLIWIW